MSALAETIAASVASSTVIWGVIQWALTSRERKSRARNEEREQERRDAETERRENRDRERAAELLAAAQSTAQRTALESANERYLNLQQDYIGLRNDMRNVKQASALLLNAFEGFILRPQPLPDGSGFSAIIQSDEVRLARTTIAEARDHLF